jgi:ubiquinone/menaquinone biosynthesis C-methylase UbiE
MFKKIRKISEKAISILSPEEYWVNRGENVIGNQTKEQMLANRQIDTYKVICGLIFELSPQKVVDCGCNVGILGVLLRDQGFNKEYVGIDFNPNALKVAEKNMASYGGSSIFYQANLRHMDFQDQAFELVVLKDILEHMEDFRPVLSDVLRVSNKYAIISNFIPWAEGSSVIRKEPAGFFHNFYSRREVYQLIQDAGFDVLSVTSTLEQDARPNEVVLLQRKG